MPQDDFELRYRETTPPPWEIGEPQPALAALARSGAVHGAVLDAGCGTGEISLLLAARGHPVTGVDGAALAVRVARAKAAARGLPARYEVADMLNLPGHDGAYDTVVDSALLHCLPVADRPRYLATLHRVTRPGARLHVLALRAGPVTAGMAHAHPLTDEGLAALPGPHWRLDTVAPAELLTLRPPSGAAVEPAADGRVHLPAHLVTLRRAED